MIKPTGLLLIILAIFSLKVQPQRTYYVSTSGNDNNDGLTESTPWRTLQYAEDHATTAGDTIALKRGDNWASLMALGIQHGGDSLNHIVWDGSLWGSGANAIISSTGDRPDGEFAIVAFGHCQNVTFQNITIDGNDYFLYGIAIGEGEWMAPGHYQNNEANIHIHNCRILDIGNAATQYTNSIMIRVWYTDIRDIEITGCYVDGAANHGIAIYGWRTALGGTGGWYLAKNIYFAYNTITNWGERGDPSAAIFFNLGISGAIAEHNYILQSNSTCAGGIAIGDGHEPNYYPKGIIVRYNEVLMTTKAAFFAWNSAHSEVDVYYNLFHSDNPPYGCIDISGSDSYTGADMNFYNNTIIVNQGEGYGDRTSTNGVCTFTNNLVINQDGGNDECVLIRSNASTIHSYNAYYKYGTGDQLYAVEDQYIYKSGMLNWEPTCITSDPLLADLEGLDFHLQKGSPILGKGKVIPGMTVDIEGVTISNPPSMGCYQSIAGSVIPVYMSSVVENASPTILEITYSSELDISSVPDPSAFNVKINSANRIVNSVLINGKKVLLTLNTPVTYGDVITIAYTQPATNKLQSTSGGIATSITAQKTTNNLITNAPIYIRSVVEDASPTILEMTYDKTLNNLVVPSASAFNVQINSVRIIIKSVSINDTKVQLTLAYPVVNGDIVTVDYTKTTSNPLQSVAGDEAASMNAKPVINNCLSNNYVVYPLYLNSIINDATPSLLEINYDIILNNDSVPAPSAFDVQVNSISRPITSLIIVGTQVQLTLDNPVIFSDIITVSYTIPVNSPLQSTSSGIAASFNSQIVTNYINDNISIDNPIYLSSAVEDSTPAKLEMTYDRDLDSLTIPATSAFNVRVFYSLINVSSVSITTNKVQLNLESPVVYGDNVTIAYTKPAGNRIRTTLGGEAASLSTQIVNNNVKEEINIINPVYITSVVENATADILKMTYDIGLDNNSIPSPTAFNVIVNTASRAVNSVAVEETEVSLTLASPILHGDIVTVAYTQPANNPLQTNLGGIAESFDAQPVNNLVEEIIINIPPVPVLKYATSSFSGFVGEIDASGSYDPNLDNLTFNWTAQDNIPISSSVGSRINYLSPIVNEIETIDFFLNISDGLSSETKSISIDILPYKPGLLIANTENIIASDYQEPNYPDNVIDNDTETLWAINGKNQWLIFDLEDRFRVSYIEIAFNINQKRKSNFDIYASKDSIIWEPILMQASSCSFSGNYQVFDSPTTLADTAFSFIKLIGQGNSQDSWNFFSEFKIFGSPYTEEMQIHIFPNPATDCVNIAINYPPVDSIADPPVAYQILRIFNMSGMIVYESSIEPNIRNIQIQINFSPGLYGIQLVHGNLISKVHKLIVAN